MITFLNSLIVIQNIHTIIINYLIKNLIIEMRTFKNFQMIIISNLNVRMIVFKNILRMIPLKFNFITHIIIVYFIIIFILNSFNLNEN